MRICLVLSLLALLAGCASVPVRAPGRAALAVVFADEFHSGVLLERSLFPADLVPAGAPDPHVAPWIVVHFGERRWISGEADGCRDAVRLAFGAGEGGVQVDVVPWWRHTRGGTDPRLVRAWVFPLADEAHAALLADLRSWLVVDRQPRSLWPGSCWHDSSRAWTLGRNCHDFTISLLVAAGIAIEGGLITQANPLRATLDRAWLSHDQALNQACIPCPDR